MRAKQMLSNVLLLTLPSLIVFFLLCEFVIFRFVPITEPIRLRFVEPWSMVTLTPNRSGIFVRGLDRKTRYRSNAEGWNSLREYAAAKGDAIRIAVIGDSYVEALNVDVENAFPELIEEELSRQGYDVEVYRFGVSGAPLSQYLHMLRYVYETFDPDIAIVNLIYNDFDESLHPVSVEKWGENGVCFVTFEPSGDGFAEVAPKAPDLTALRYRIIDTSRVLRFAFYQMLLENRLTRLMDRLSRLFGGGPEFQQNVTLDVLEAKEPMTALTRHIFSEIGSLSERRGVRLVLTIDAPREYIHRQEDPRDAEVYWFNEMSLEIADETGIEIIDLTEGFLRDHQRRGLRFNSKTDGHWSETGHRVVARIISEFLVERGWLTSAGARGIRSRPPNLRPRPGAPRSPEVFAWRDRP